MDNKTCADFEKGNRSPIIIRLLVLGLLLAGGIIWLHIATGPWTENGKTRAAFNNDFNHCLSALYHSYMENLGIIQIVKYRMDKEAARSDLRFNEVLRFVVKNKARTCIDDSIKPLTDLSGIQSELDDLYRSHSVTKDQLAILDDVKARINRNMEFTLLLVNGDLDDDILQSWTAEVSGFYSVRDRISTDLDLPRK